MRFQQLGLTSGRPAPRLKDFQQPSKTRWQTPEPGEEFKGGADKNRRVPHARGLCNAVRRGNAKPETRRQKLEMEREISPCGRNDGRGKRKSRSLAALGMTIVEREKGGRPPRRTPVYIADG